MVGPGSGGVNVRVTRCVDGVAPETLRTRAIRRERSATATEPRTILVVLVLVAGREEGLHRGIGLGIELAQRLLFPRLLLASRIVDDGRAQVVDELTIVRGRGGVDGTLARRTR
jgi:hypothetical protein